MVFIPDFTPYFNIIIPNCNRADVITATLRPMPAGTFFAPEIIVVDDGSKDNTAVAAGQFADTLLYCLSKQNKERGRARSHSLDRAKGECGRARNSDDLFQPSDNC